MLEITVQTNPLGHNVDLAERAYRIRRNALRMGEVQGQGYIAQALGVADVLAVSYFRALRYRPEDPHWEGATGSCSPSATTPSPSTRSLIEAGIVPRSGWRPTAATTATCRCRAWPPTRRHGDQRRLARHRARHRVGMCLG
jgi:hypothetical protein